MKFGISKTAYYADFYTVPLLIAALFVVECTLLDGWRGVARWLYLAPLGGLAWSLTEYWVHRLLFHGRGRYADEHHMHHVRPVTFIGVSPYATVSIALMLYVALLFIFDPTTAGGLLAGMLAWYLVYIYSHDLYHHSRPRRGAFWYAQMRRHDAHHSKGDVNYGVSSPLWDIAFHTHARAYAVLILVGMLAGCGGSSSPPPPSPPPIIIAVPPPASPPITAWAITHGSTPSALALDTSGLPYFDFPLCASASACWVSYVEQPYGALTGKSLVTLSYSIAGSAPTFDGHTPGNNCEPVTPAISLLLHHAGDNMSGVGPFAFYRWFSTPVAQPLTLGDHTLSVPLTVDKWVPVYSSTPDANAQGFATALASNGSIGFVFGGGCFAGHGVAITSGSARFTINGVVVQ